MTFSNRVIDFHTHAFPDSIADKAMAALCAGSEAPAYLDGRLGSLLASMDKAGVEKSVVCNIATRPKQFEPIFEWCKQVASERIVPLPSFHPADPAAVEQIYRIADAGFKGIKLHPYYQEFALDEPRMDPMYKAISDKGLLLVCHTGFDIAYDRYDAAGPKRIISVVNRFPAMKFIATHLGAWEQWDQVRELLLGKPIYMELSYSMEYFGAVGVREFLLSHPAEYVLFGTDSPWADQSAAIKAIESLQLPEKTLQSLLYSNAQRLLG